MAKAKRTCTFDGCDLPQRTRALCITHYGQLRLGKPLTPRRRRMADGASTQEKLDQYTDKSGECWLWTGGTHNTGYGRITVGAAGLLAHRVSYENEYGSIPDGLHIDHKCHTPLCVRPTHLQAVTRQLNQENRAGATKVCKSGVRGVHWHEASKSWGVRVRAAGRVYSGGYFKSVPEAEIAAIKLRNSLHTNNLADRSVEVL